MSISVATYGAQGDTKISEFGQVTSGLPTLTLNPSGTGDRFSYPGTADVGKTIVVSGAGPGGASLIATITAVGSQTSATLNVASSATLTGTSVNWGTDDTAAFFSALATLQEVYVPAVLKGYLITAPLLLAPGQELSGDGYQSYVKWCGGVKLSAFGNISNTSSTLTLSSSAQGVFSSSDVGKSITVNGAGAGGSNLIATVSAFSSSTSVSLSVAAGATVTGAATSWGTSDAPAIAQQNWQNANSAGGDNISVRRVRIYDSGTPTRVSNYTIDLSNGGYCGLVEVEVEGRLLAGLTDRFGILLGLKPNSTYTGKTWVCSLIRCNLRRSKLVINTTDGFVVNNEIYALGRDFAVQVGGGNVISGNNFSCGTVDKNQYSNVKGMLYIRGDTKRSVFGAMTSGNATLTLSSSANDIFTSDDVTRSVIVAGAGASGADLVAKINSVTNSTTAVLSSTAQSSVSGATVNWFSIQPQVLNLKVSGNMFDGGGSYLVGNCILSDPFPQLLSGSMISGNHFRTATREGIKLQNVEWTTITGNTFRDCDADDTGEDDALIIGNGNVFSNNAHHRGNEAPKSGNLSEYGVMTASSSALALSSSAEDVFSASDATQHLQIEVTGAGPGASDGVLATTISSYTDSQHVTLVIPAVSTVNSALVRWGVNRVRLNCRSPLNLTAQAASQVDTINFKVTSSNVATTVVAGNTVTDLTKSWIDCVYIGEEIAVVGGDSRFAYSRVAQPTEWKLKCSVYDVQGRPMYAGISWERRASRFGGMTGGTTGLSLSASSDSTFSQSDVGKPISVAGAGPAGTSLYTTIATYSSSTSVTLAASAVATVSNRQVEWGTSTKVSLLGNITTGTTALSLSGATQDVFALTDVGKRITISGAGAGGIDFATTISGFTDSTHVAVAQAASTTVTNKMVSWDKVVSLPLTDRRYDFFVDVDQALDTSHQVVFFKIVATTRTITLPPANSYGLDTSGLLIIRRTDTVVTPPPSLTIAAATGDTINGASSITIAALSGKVFVANGTTGSWFTL